MDIYDNNSLMLKLKFWTELIQKFTRFNQNHSYSIFYIYLNRVKNLYIYLLLKFKLYILKVKVCIIIKPNSDINHIYVLKSLQLNYLLVETYGLFNYRHILKLYTSHISISNINGFSLIEKFELRNHII
jgi:hypothetical protein